MITQNDVTLSTDGAPAPQGALDRLLDDAAGLARLVTALVAEEVGRLRGRPVEPAEWRAWGRSTRVDEDDLGIDSLARLELVARLNRFFQLHRSGVEDYLLIRRSLGDWTEIVGAGLRALGEHELCLTFDTSGTTGAPQPAEHRLADLVQEVGAHDAFRLGTQRTVCLVPPHHLYGFLFGVLGPALAQSPVVDARGWGTGRLLAALQPGDTVVATPFLWSVLLRSGAAFPPGVSGVTSTAPADPALWHALGARGLQRLVEVYGSTESAGVGHRDRADAAFTLLPHLSRAGEALPPAGQCRVIEPSTLPDETVWLDCRRFRVVGRRDGAVQVGGTNVFPERVRAHLQAHPAVAECAVRLDAGGPSARLCAFVVPVDMPLDATGEQALQQTLHADLSRILTAPERPAHYTFGAALPRNAFGKPQAWT